jgi:hypothetical protein
LKVLVLVLGILQEVWCTVHSVVWECKAGRRVAD